jgi:catechol-2,3-dioxygenase
MRLSRLRHVNLRVADVERSKWFYTEVLGLRIAEQDPEHGGVFTTLGESFHAFDFAQHPHADAVQRPARDQVGLLHVAFQVDSYDALREAYVQLLRNGVPIDHATDHVNQRSLYFYDPDGNGLEIYYELPYALELFPEGRADADTRLPVGGPDDPVPGWLLEPWPSADLQSRIAAIRQQKQLEAPPLAAPA